MPALAVWTPEDGLLGALAPLGLAAAAPGPCLVLDLDEAGPRYPGQASLADLVADRPRLGDLRPERQGIALLRNGGVGATAAADILEAMLAGWDNVVLRLPPRRRLALPVPVVPVRHETAAAWFPQHKGPAVYQRGIRRSREPVMGVRLPIPARSTVAALSRGEAPPVWDRWVRSWRSVWGLRWDL